jgi:DNA invertase Pin-like site-specific DNA recombinase
MNNNSIKARKSNSRKTMGQINRERIRLAYSGQLPIDLEVIPAKADLIAPEDKPKLRTCAYCRVSTDEDQQQGSFELQQQDFQAEIQKNDDWVFAGIYADEGISGTNVLHRKEFNRMIEDCKAGKIDQIVTKSISRFARNVLDCIGYIRLLKALSPPVGVFFQNERLFTLDPNTEMIITVLSTVAQGESATKSEAIKWGLRKRFAHGIPLCPTWQLLGYDTDEEGNMVIVEEEAKIVRLIYKFYLEGNTSSNIANALTQSGVPTIRGSNSEWSAGTILSILHNERYCGDVIMQKTVTLDYLTHKSVKNCGHEKQYILRNHHPAIVSRSDWEQVQKLILGWRQRNRKQQRVNEKPIVVRKGTLAGYVIINPNWVPQNLSQNIKIGE